MSMFNSSPATKIRATEGFVPNMGINSSQHGNKIKKQWIPNVLINVWNPFQFVCRQQKA